MVEFHESMDGHSLDVSKQGKGIAYIQWHPEREPRLVWREAFDDLTIDEMRQCLNRLEEEVERVKRNALLKRAYQDGWTIQYDRPTEYFYVHNPKGDVIGQSGLSGHDNQSDAEKHLAKTYGRLITR
jgi:hypothetical protein